MTEKLTWDEIKQRYDGEWVLLLNYDWPDHTPWPRAGVVCAHDPDRKAFWRKVKGIEPRPRHSAGLFVGPPDPPGLARNNLMTITACES